MELRLLRIKTLTIKIVHLRKNISFANFNSTKLLYNNDEVLGHNSNPLTTNRTLGAKWRNKTFIFLIAASTE